MMKLNPPPHLIYFQTKTATPVFLQRDFYEWGGAEWNNEPVIRISICSWATTMQDIDRSVEAFIDARKLAKN